MKVKFLMAFLALLMWGGLICPAKNNQSMKSYNFSRALEELEKGTNEEAIGFFNKEIQDNPKNGYAFLSLAMIHFDRKDYNDAMSSINKAIKFIPRKDKPFGSRALMVRGTLYAAIGDTIQALKDLGAI